MATQVNSVAIQSLLDAANATASKTKTTSRMDDAQDRFLKLLTTQMKNQDPLNPMDNAQVTSQLAQISTVDGIEKLNTTLQKMLSSSLDSETMQAAALVGRSVMVAGNDLQLNQAGALGGFELSGTADQVTVTIKDANGLVVKTISLGRQEAGLQNFVWDGTSDSGAAAATGSYKATVEAKRGSDKIPVTTLELANVISVSRGSQGIDLDLGNLGLAKMTDIKQIF